jgi:1-deoxy-D-xylulose-5-phosphate synthase
MIETQYTIDHLPSVVRYPRGNGYGAEILKDVFGYQDAENLLPENQLPARGKVLPLGQGRVLKKGTTGKKYRVAILSIGTRAVESVLAARALEAKHPDISVIVADARFMKPLDESLIQDLATMNDVLITIEEGSKSGFGSIVSDFLINKGIMDKGLLRFRSMYIPDIWIEAGSQKEQYDIAQLNQEHIVQMIENLVEPIRNYR